MDSRQLQGCRAQVRARSCTLLQGTLQAKTIMTFKQVPLHPGATLFRLPVAAIAFKQSMEPVSKICRNEWQRLSLLLVVASILVGNVSAKLPTAEFSMLLARFREEAKGASEVGGDAYACLQCRHAGRHVNDGTMRTVAGGHAASNRTTHRHSGMDVSGIGQRKSADGRPRKPPHI